MVVHSQHFYPSLAGEFHAVANPVIKPKVKAKFGVPQEWATDPIPVRRGGPLLAGFHPVVPDNGYHNFLAAFRKRCNYFSAARASPRVIACSLKLINVLCPEPMAPFEWSHQLYSGWVSKFGSEKQARMEGALNEFCLSQSIDDYSRKDVFVKTEALLVGHKPNWAPRVIYKGTDLYNAVSGPIFCELMSRLSGSYDHMKGPHRFRLAYKRQATDYTPFLTDSLGEFVESDFAANDMRQCSDVMLLELQLMRRLGCPEWFVRLHSRTNHFKVANRRHRVKATLDFQLPTGATDTTFRNSFWNSAILYTFLEEIGATMCRAIILGDDMLARIQGLRRHAAKTYVAIAKEAQMVAEVSRHSHLVDCSFLSKLFVPRQNGGHLTVPLLGKALGKFNMRANKNDALSDHAYFAGKAVGYAYEFRHVPELRDIFLQRFQYEYGFAREERHALRFADAEVSWNAREAGITLRNVKDKIVLTDDLVVWYDDFFAFCSHRYSLFASDVVELFTDVVLSPGSLVDAEGKAVEVLARDFL